MLNNGKGGPPKKVFQFRNTDGDRAKFRADTMIPLLIEVTQSLRRSILMERLLRTLFVMMLLSSLVVLVSVRKQ